jgi:hypothetical protein
VAKTNVAAPRIVRHQDGSRTINGKIIPKQWAELPETYISTDEPAKNYVAFPIIYSTYGTTYLEVYHTLLELAANGVEFSVAGFTKNVMRGRNGCLYVNTSVLPALSNKLAERGERRAARGINGIKAVTGVAQGKMMNGESLDTLAFTADRVLRLIPLMTAAFEELAKQVKTFAEVSKKKNRRAV